MNKRRRYKQKRRAYARKYNATLDAITLRAARFLWPATTVARVRETARLSYDEIQEVLHR